MINDDKEIRFSMKKASAPERALDDLNSVELRALLAALLPLLYFHSIPEAVATRRDELLRIAGVKKYVLAAVFPLHCPRCTAGSEHLIDKGAQVTFALLQRYSCRRCSFTFLINKDQEHTVFALPEEDAP